ncbi:MAG: hypothetical protein KGJ59_15125, partial [Bacteroidota bacterium]|nr:hypothetical protein [Bacteroidota bacterium]
ADAKQFLPRLARKLRASADEEMAVKNFLRFIEASFNPTTLFRDITEHSILLDMLVATFSTSQFFSDILVRDPELFHWLTTTTALERPKRKEEFLSAAKQTASLFHLPEKKINALKRFQRRESLRIGMRDILGHADLETTARELSHLADVVFQLVAELMWNELSEKYGAAPITSWVIFALGKLGGEELNYSSDIDIIAVFDEDGVRDSSTRRITHGEFFTRFIGRIVQTLTAVTEEGFFYRVDTRLRPDGDSGPLIRSFAATMTYYESRGELWERQMLIKARRIAGDEVFAARLLHALTPFIYPRSFFRSPVEEIAAIKARIENASEEQNIKLCRGGIRDVEFIVQSLQLVNAGQHSALQNGTTLNAIELLRKHEILSHGEAESLREAYTFFRTLEHRLQMMDYEQLHTLPSEKNERQALARRMNLPHAKFERLLAQHRAKVRKIFNGIFSSAPKTVLSDIEHIASEKKEAPPVGEFFRRFNIQNSTEAHRALKRLMFGSTLTGRKELTEQTRALFKASAETFFAEISRTPSPGRTLLNAEKIIAAFPAKDSLYKLLVDERFCRALVTVCGKSARIARTLSNFPDLTEMMMTRLPELASGTLQPPSPHDIVTWKVRSEIQAAIRYELNETDEQTLFRALTHIAEKTVLTAFDDAFSKMHFSKETQFVVIGLGKFGGEEINFDSDLDLLFLYRTENKSEAVKCEKLSAQLIANLSKSDSHGRLYSIDTRLRPEGKNAPLAVSLAAFNEYLHKRASLWERQSLTRSRFIAGSETLGKQAMRTMWKFVYSSPLPSGWQKEILAMRTKTESRSRTFSAQSVDIKVAAGGLMDIEFCMQALQLSQRKNADASTNMFDLLAKYSREHEFAESIRQLNDNYHLLRKTETALRLSLDTQTNMLPS